MEIVIAAFTVLSFSIVSMSCSLCVRVRVCLFLLNWNFKWSKMNCNWSCKYKYWSRRSVVVVCGSDTQEKRVRKRTRTIQGGFNQNQLRTLYNFAKQSRTEQRMSERLWMLQFHIRHIRQTLNVTHRLVLSVSVNASGCSGSGHKNIAVSPSLEYRDCYYYCPAALSSNQMPEWRVRM